MNQEQRRKAILERLKGSENPVSGTELARRYQVSRQIIVRDIAALKEAGCEIFSTYQGYLCRTEKRAERVFRVRHSDDEIEEELNTIVDNGGTVRDVWVEHEVYGRIRAELKIGSRRKVGQFMEEIRSGKSSPLKNLTSGIHFHTVEAESGEILDQIERELEEKGYLIREEDTADRKKSKI